MRRTVASPSGPCWNLRSCCYTVGDGRLWGVSHPVKGAASTLAALRSIRAAAFPDGAPI